MIATSTTPTSSQASAPAGPVRPAPLRYGSVAARALYELWSGTSVVVVNSPPGAGKTTLVAEVVHNLLDKGMGASIGIATPTRRAAADIAGRVAETLNSKDPATAAGNVHLTLSNIRPDERRQGVASVTFAGNPAQTVKVSTIASCTIKQPQYDLLIIDEAYQVTLDQLVRAAANCTQLLLVGDPGQIGPVVTANTGPWEGASTQPHRRAPEIVSDYPDATVLNLTSTYRVGADTVEVISPLYGFDFDSLRPDRHIALRDGRRLPEVGHVRIGEAPNTTDLRHMRQVVEVARQMVGAALHETVDGTETTRTLTPADVAVVVSHNSQSNGVMVLLDELGLGEVVVGTADKLQGGQWPAVVALDPVVGHRRLSEHQLNLGRLCVMLSRHQAALVWVHDGQADGLLAPHVADGSADAATGLEVRERILSRPAVELAGVGAAA